MTAPRYWPRFESFIAAASSSFLYFYAMCLLIFGKLQNAVGSARNDTLEMFQRRRRLLEERGNHSKITHHLASRVCASGPPGQSR